MVNASKAKILFTFTNLNNKGKLVLLFSFVLILVLLMRKVRHADIVKSEPLFRRTSQRIRSSDDEFCLVSYNILADGPWSGTQMPIYHFRWRRSWRSQILRHRQDICSWWKRCVRTTDLNNTGSRIQSANKILKPPAPSWYSRSSVLCGFGRHMLPICCHRCCHGFD